MDLTADQVAAAAATPTTIEQFSLRNVQVVELHPDEDPGVDTPNVTLAMTGAAAWGPKVYVTAVEAEQAIAFGQMIVEAGQALLARGPAAPAIDVASSMAEAHQVARAAEAASNLRA